MTVTEIATAIETAWAAHLTCAVCGAPTTHRRVCSLRCAGVLGGKTRRQPAVVGYRTLTTGGEMEMIHRLRAERALGKPLPRGARVHHADGSKNEGAALVICPSEKYHQFLHIRMRTRAAGGNPNAEKLCSVCRQPKPFSAFSRCEGYVYGLDYQCRGCKSQANRQGHARRCREREANCYGGDHASQ